MIVIKIYVFGNIFKLKSFAMICENHLVKKNDASVSL